MKSSDVQFGFNFSHDEADGTGDASACDTRNENERGDSDISREPYVYTVSEINSLIRRRLEGEFREIWIRGEISNFKPHSSGHYYFSLKDDGAQIGAVMFRGLNSKLKFKPENGLEVLIHGKITVYEPRGNYQVFCEFMEPVGAGALQKAFEQLKEKLNAEGLFALEKKRAIPKYPRHIGLVTSPTGAALQDILNVLRRRYKSAKITLAPALVQGDEAADSIVQALTLINKVKDIDVLIVGRGGGSIEDMWCFNEERVARAIAASRIPVISAVGHEIDFTIADFVADLRAPTPSAAAELVAKSVTETLERIRALKLCLWQCWQSAMARKSERAYALGKRLIDPQRRLRDLQFRNDELMVRLEGAIFRHIENQGIFPERYHFRLSTAMQKSIESAASHLREAAGRLHAMSPLRVVSRGYSIVKKTSGEVVNSSMQLHEGDLVEMTFAKGRAEAKIEKVLQKNAGQNAGQKER